MRAGDFERDADSGLLLPRHCVDRARRRGVLHERPQFMCGPAFFGGGGGAPGADVRINLQFEGANGSTTFTDTGSGGSTWSGTGGATISTASPLAGSSSLALAATSDYLQSSAYGTANRIPPTGDWDLQFMVNCGSWSTTQGQYLVSVQDATPTAAGTAFAIATTYQSPNVKLLLVLSDGSARTVPLIGTSGLISNVVYTVLVSRRGNTVTLYLNGASQGSATYTAAINTPSGQAWRIGRPTYAPAIGPSGTFDAFTLTAY